MSCDDLKSGGLVCVGFGCEDSFYKVGDVQAGGFPKRGEVATLVSRQQCSPRAFLIFKQAL